MQLKIKRILVLSLLIAFLASIGSAEETLNLDNSSNAALNLTDTGNIDNSSNATLNLTDTGNSDEENTSINTFSGSQAEATKPKIAYVFSRPYDVAFMSNVTSNPDISSQMNISVYLGTSYANLSFDLSDSDMIILSDLGPYVIESIAQTVNEAKANGAYVISHGATVKGYGLHNVNTSAPEYSCIDEYLQYVSETNFYRFNTYIGKTFFDLNYSVEDPVDRPIYGIYHPSAPQIYENLTEYLSWYNTSGVYNPENLTVAIITDSYTYMNMNGELLDSLVEGVESRGCNAIVTTYTYKDNNSMSFLMLNNKSVADVAIVLSRGSRFNYRDEEQGIEDLQTLNITIMNGARLFSEVTVGEWENSTSGIPSDQRYQVAYAELDGMIEPIVISGKATDETTGAEYNQPIDYQIDWMVERAISWADLHRKANSEKKILISYYNPEGGKADVGADIDYYLDAQASLENLLQAMKDRGYNTGEEELPNATEIAALMTEKGHNIGTWVPGELEKCVENGSAILIPESQYLSWFDELPEEKQEEITSMWGEAPGNIMVYENSTGKYIVIPVLRFGNILLAPDPQNGWASSDDAIYNNASYPPTHQCFAFYKYMAEEYKADAIFSIFSSIELMPGKECGLSAKDWGALLMQDMPHVHVLPMDAEGVFDKRRANMLVVDFMTPTLVPSGLYEELANLLQDITLFNQASDSTVREVYRQSILNQTEELGLDTDLDVDLEEIAGNTTLTDSFISDLQEYLQELKTAYMPYGSHVLGEPPEGESLVMLIKGMLGDEFVENVSAAGGNEELALTLLNETILNSTSPYDAQMMVLGQNSTDVGNDLDLALEYLERIEECKCEVPKVLDALDATYIMPGPSGDPIRNPDALPTGRNLYTFDDRLIPTKAAWIVGSQLAEELIETKKENGEYPEKIAFLLWSVETTRNQGVMEAEILKLLGVEPQYDSRNRVSYLRLMNSTELNRSRIDVLVVTSGLYRDVYSSKIELLDEAIKMAAAADNDTYPNYVKEHSDATYQALLDAGYNESLAANLSVSKIFCPSSGAYTPGIQEAITSDTWDDADEIADLYIDRMGYVYGQDMWGEQYTDVFKLNLADVDTAVFSRTSNLYGVLDHTMVAAYFGGLSLAVESVSGNTPDMYINDLSSSAEIETLSEFLCKDLRSRYLNPTWIEGMMGNGFDGTRYMDSVFEVMRIWDVTSPDLITDDMWNELYDTYFADQYDTGVTEFLKSTNPYAYQSMAATALESARTGYWGASEEVIQALVSEYVKSVVENGVTCCHHTCGNALLEEYIEGIMSVPGVVDEQTAEEYKKLVQEAKGVSSQQPEESSSSSSSHSSHSTGSAAVINTTKANANSGNQTIESDGGYGTSVQQASAPSKSSVQASEYVEGYEMTNDTREEAPEKESSGMSFSGADLLGALFVVICLGGIYLGFQKKKN